MGAGPEYQRSRAFANCRIRRNTQIMAKMALAPGPKSPGTVGRWVTPSVSVPGELAPYHSNIERTRKRSSALAALGVLFVQVLWIGASGASSTPTLRVSVESMAWAGGAVTLAVTDVPRGVACRVTVSRGAVIATRRRVCGPGVHRASVHLPSNDSPIPVRYRIALAPGSIAADVTVMSANHGNGLRITSQPTNTAVSTSVVSRN